MTKQAKTPKAKSPGAQTAGAQTAADTGQYLGVPDDYSAHIRTGSEPTFDVSPTPGPAGLTATAGLRSVYADIAPHYKTGQEYSLISLTPDQVMDYQARLEAAGLLDAGYTKGDGSDPQTIAAYRELLSRSNLAGLDEKEMLSRITASHQSQPPKKRDPLVVTLTNPEDIKAVVNHTGRALYGGVLPDSTTQAIVDAVQANERNAQQSAYDTAGMTDAGGTVVAPPSPSAAATTEDVIRKEHPNEVAATQFADMFDSILSTMNTSPSNYQGIKYP